jgi:hypothetical protein
VGVNPTYNTGIIEFYPGKGNGTFGSPKSTKLSYGIYELLAADFNGDGKLDLAIQDRSNYQEHILLGNGRGKFTEVSSYQGTALSVGDFNGDGKLDVIFLYSDYGYVYLGNGDGTFYAQGDSFYLSAAPAVGDFNGDGILDLANPDNQGVTIYLGHGDGTFGNGTFYYISSNSEAVAVDVNHDGILDIVTGGVGVLFGNGDGTFTVGPVTSEPGYGLMVGDFNGDGEVDVAVSNNSYPDYKQTVYMMLGDGTGNFGNPIKVHAGYNANGVTGFGMADFNRDGELDFVIATQNTSAATPPLVLFQSSKNSWLPH